MFSFFSSFFSNSTTESVFDHFEMKSVENVFKDEKIDSSSTFSFSS
jgi:hypothetical protein